MKRESNLRPVLLVHPDREEAEYLVERLQRERIVRRIVIFAEIADVQDYIETVTLGGEDGFAPCAILLDDKLGKAAVLRFAEWIRTIPRMQAVRLATLSDRNLDDSGAWGTDQTVPAGALDILAGLLTRACES